MGYVVPHTFVTNEFPTAGNLNSMGTGSNWNAGGSSGRRPSFRAHMAAVQSIPNSAATVVKFDTVDEDVDGAYSTSTGLYTCVTAGLYYVFACGFFAANATGVRVHMIQSSGWPAVLRPALTIANDGAGNLGVSIADGLVRLSVGQTFDIAAFQTSGGALNTGTGLGTGTTPGQVVCADLISL